jgi:hypothetical protein
VEWRLIAKLVMAGTPSAKTRFALLPGHDEKRIFMLFGEPGKNGAFGQALWRIRLPYFTSSQPVPLNRCNCM